MTDEHDSALAAEQPPPKPNASRPVWDLVIDDMRARDRLGRKRYGVPLQAHNGRDALRDAYEESLDLAVYLRQAIAERDGVAVPAEPCRWCGGCLGPHCECGRIAEDARRAREGREALRLRAEELTRLHPPGTPCRYWPMDRRGEGRAGKIRSAYRVTNAGELVVFVSGQPGHMLASHVEPEGGRD